MKGYQIKIIIAESKPVVQRRIIIPAQLTFKQLHQCIQYLFGWQDYHSYFFDTKDAFIRMEVEDFQMGFSTHRKALVKAADAIFQTYAKVNDTMTYIYDMGDSWEHQILVEKAVEVMEDYPVLVDWKNENLAEDSGGIHQYYQFMKTLKRQKGSQYEEMFEWYQQQHRDFKEGDVITLLRSISLKPNAASTSSLLIIFLHRLKDILKTKQIKDLCSIRLREGNQLVLFAITKLHNDYSIQIYEDEDSYLQGVEYVSSFISYNFYANGYSLILMDDDSSTIGYAEETDTCFATRLKTGYSPLELTSQEQANVLHYIDDLVAILDSYPSQQLPTMEDLQMLDCEIKDSIEIATIPFQLSSTYESPHLSKKDIATLKKQAIFTDIANIDIVGLENEENPENMITIRLIIDTNDITLTYRYEQKDLQSFSSLSKQTIAYIKTFMEEHGRMKTIFVNNENCYMILNGLCQDLNIQLKRDDFISTLEANFAEKGNSEKMEYLQKLMYMDNREFISVIKELDEEELNNLQDFMMQFLPKNITIEDLIKREKKKHFDA